MATSNESKNNEWEEIETISVQNNALRETDNEIEETSFIEENEDLSIDKRKNTKIANDEAGTETQITREIKKKTFSPSHSEEITMVETTDRESVKTRDSRRPSADTSIDCRSITSQSDTRSYRDKLKDRINVVKERASGFTASAQRVVSKSYARNSKSIMLNRITDILLKEEADVKEALERHKKTKEMRKQKNEILNGKAVDSVNQENQEEISYATSLEFFTKVWKFSEGTGSTESILNSPQMDTGTDNTHISPNESDDCTKLLAADYLGLKDSLMEPVEFKPAVLINKDMLHKKENTIFCPSTTLVPMEQRTGKNHEPQNRKYDGFYVPNFTEVRSRNMNKMHQRLITEKNIKWFGNDGEIIRLPSPLESEAYHPFHNNEGNDSTEIVVRFEPASLFDSEEEDRFSAYINPGECYVLELKIINVVFTHHPLFSREHVLANRFLQLYEKYQHRLNVNVTKRLYSKLKALRTAHDNLKKVTDSEENQDMISAHRERLTRYKIEIKETRKQRMLEGKSDNILLMNLLSTWKDLKRIRTEQGYSSTGIKIQIVKLDNDVSAEEWQNEIKRQIEEVIEETKEHEREEKEFDENKSDNDVTTDKSINKNFDFRSIQESVIEEVTESIPAPGEPYFTVSLVEQEITSDKELTNAMEIQRRSLMNRSRVWLKIFYNKHEVCKSTPQYLERQFTCTFNQKFSIRLQEWPETLSMQVFCDGVPNKGIFSDHPLAEIFIPLPASGTTLDNVSVDKYEFSSTNEVGSGVRHSGVGSGVPFKLFPESEKNMCSYTTASITFQAGWGINNEQVLSPPECFFNKNNFRRKITETDVNLQSDITKLKEWFKIAQLDPNDPGNVAVFELLKVHKCPFNYSKLPVVNHFFLPSISPFQSGQKSLVMGLELCVNVLQQTKADMNINEREKYFNIDSSQKLFDFCLEDDLTSNTRLKLLMLRDRGEIEFKSIKIVPLREWEIPKDIFKTYEKRVSSPELPFDTIGLGQLEIHRAWGQHSLNMLYDRILKQCKLSQQHRNTQDVVQEEKVPDIGTLGLTFMKLLQPKRPLRPRRKGRKRIPVKGLTGQEVKVIVNVVRAFEVPIRKDVDTLTDDNICYVPVRPFVEVTFKDQTKRTVTADGANPTWNQDLHFSLIGPNDSNFQVNNMHSFGDSLHIHLFDEIVVDILEDERMRDTTIHQRLERNWLGSLRIPFSTLYFNHQIEGTFQLYSSPFLLGYDRQVSLASSDHSYLRNSTFLTLFIIVQPPLSPPDPIMEHLECSEPSYIEQHLELWWKEVNKEIPRRPVKTLVTDISGKSVCVTRFFRSISPPVIYENETTTPEMIVRYVSLIPISTSGTLLFGHFNVWMTCDQTIRLLLGEREDHAILLCCFLIKLGLKAWLLFGNGIPHGHSAYVLTRHDAPLTTPVYNIWDPVTGLKYSSMDSFSPLHKVYCLINDENVWVNIQIEELVRRTNFDVSQRSDWWPAFGRNMSVPVTSVQPTSIEYTTTSATDVHLLQDKIEKYLRDSIMKWRPTSRTVWNRYCIATLRKLLPVMEREACGLKQQSSFDHLNELQHILGSHKICGFPISQPFTNIKAIIEAVKSTGVHLNESADVEFALAVYVHPYPNDVLSVWVYAVSLIARR